MTNDKKPPMFGPTAILDLTAYEPRAGKSGLPFKFVFDSKNNGHTFAFGTTRQGMSCAALWQSQARSPKPMHCSAPACLVKALAAAVVSIAAAGCTNMSGLGGSSEFQCKAPEGIPCQSVSGVYANDMADNLPSSRAHQSRTPSSEGGNTGDQVATAHAPGLVGSATAAPALGAIRSEPTVIRIWMAPWEDADGDLNEESRVYLQIDNGRWLIEHNRDRIRAEFAPATPVTFPPAQVPMGLQSSTAGAAGTAHAAPPQALPGALPQQQPRVPAGLTPPNTGGQR